jgi:hypothetical protein
MRRLRPRYYRTQRPVPAFWEQPSKLTLVPPEGVGLAFPKIGWRPLAGPVGLGHNSGECSAGVAQENRPKMQAKKKPL